LQSDCKRAGEEELKLKIIKELKQRDQDVTVFASLPDMGRVGGLVSSFLQQTLKAELVAEISSVEKPWVSYSNGVVKSIIDTYRIYYDNFHRHLIFTGDTQPQEPSELYALCNTFLDFAQSAGNIKLVYSAGGYLREQLAGAPKVCGVVNRPELKKLLDNSAIETVGNEITTITWFNGLILGIAAERGIDGIGLFGEISDTAIPQPLAAKSIVGAFARLQKIRIDLKPLDEQYESVMEDVQKQKKEPSKFGPGIG
jgi:proteasome assembly chaperone (PAC2) family protein